MGTTCIFRVIDRHSNKTVANVYSQYDGHPEGLPSKIFSWMSKGEVGSGISSKLNEEDIFFNGAGDLAVQLVIQCKIMECGGINERGTIYLVSEDDSAMWEYEVYVEEDQRPYIEVVKNDSLFWSGDDYDFADEYGIK